MIDLHTKRVKPLGTGRIYPTGSLRDCKLTETLASYKENVAGSYISISPDAIPSSIPDGLHIASTKIDGEQWFLCKDVDDTVLVSPGGKVITGIPITEDAKNILPDWTGVLAGELYATVDTGKPRVYDLHAALGGGIDAQTGRLRFAVFDILVDGEQDIQALPFTERIHRIMDLLPASQCIHPVDFTEINGPHGMSAFFDSRMQDRHEGIVVHLADGRILKIKQIISIDAAVVAYASTSRGIGELLLGLMLDNDNGSSYIRLIGRVDIGFSVDERKTLAPRLEPLQCESSLHLSSRSGLPYRWVRPELIVEASCHELLHANAEGEPVRRWEVEYTDSGWAPVGKMRSISMRDAVFVRTRDDKRAWLPDIRWSQVGDFIPPSYSTVADQPPSDDICREVYTKRIRNYGTAVRKFTAWKTNKDDVDPMYPAYAVFFTDYSPGRQYPIRTELKTASSIAAISGIIKNWITGNTGRGWECVSKCGILLTQEDEDGLITLPSTDSHTLSISFARSTSPTFPLVRKRIDTLSELGELNITADNTGKEAWFELSINGGLVLNYRRITNILSMVRRWKSTEVSLDGELLTMHDLDTVLERLDEVRRCYMKNKSSGHAGCIKSSTLGCRCIRITPSERFLEGAFMVEPQWYAVGRFDGKTVQVDKDSIISHVNRRRNGMLDSCPLYSKDSVISVINDLPDALSPDDAGYHLVYRRDDGLPAWVWPEHAPLPPRLAERKVDINQSNRQDHGIYIGNNNQNHISVPPNSHHIRPAVYSDVCGQDEAVQAVRDMIELPMKYAHLFESVGVSPKPGGIILAGPPGTGKTLLARAVAGECEAHLEVVSGPELLNPYVGATEQALREIFERAGRNAPSLILFDELDSIAPSRSTADAHHQRSAVAQLLALLDGIDTRSGISVLATTNRPNSIDPALRRPGRFDRVIWMKLPDEEGRAAILRHYLKTLKLDASIEVDTYAAELASLTDGASGADLEFLCNTAARLCVKDAISSGMQSDVLTIRCDHFERALLSLGYDCAVSHNIIPVIP
ncbi:MAG: AAA family ATPase [Armatimonadota bacterium]